MEECEKFKNKTNLYNICIGKSDLPKWKINKYRVMLGLSLLYDEEDFTPPCVNSTPKAVQQKASKKKSKYSLFERGVGTELLKIYEKAGVPACSKCIELANVMNKMGVEKCSENIEFLVEDIFPRAKAWVQDNHPWIHSLFPNALEDAGIRMKIRLDINKAIANYKRNTSNTPIKLAKPKRNGGCGCGK